MNGQATNKVDAATNIVFKYAYDDDDRLTNRWTPAKGATIYGYDALGDLTSVTYTNSPSISFSYDPDDRLTNMVDGIGDTAFSYDSVGELLSEGGLWPNDTLNYAYQNRLRMEMDLAHPDGSSWGEDYGYGSGQRLTSVASPAGTFGFNYDPVKLQRVDELSLPNGAYITNKFDSLARLLSTALMSSNGTNLDSQNYVYNVAGQRTSETNAAGDYRNYTYDNEGELTKALAKDANGSNRLQEQFTYVYDAAGNLNIRTNNALAQFFKVNGLNELTIATNSGKLTVAGTTTTTATNVTVNGLLATQYMDATFALGGFTVTNGTNIFIATAKDRFGNHSTNSVTVFLPATNNYTYDLNGNLLTDRTRNFIYDTENELIGVWATNSWSNSFAYDGMMRRRIERDYTWQSGSWQETNEIHFIYDGNVVVEERNASNVPLVSYTRGNDLSGTLDGAGGIGGLLARTTYGQEQPGAPTTTFCHADGNGNITALMYPNGQLAAKYLYDPFGNILAMSGPLASFNKYRFSSQEWNDNAGLYYFGRRFYDPILQRWINRDPIEESEGLNLYDFVFNDALDWVDFLGLSPKPSQWTDHHDFPQKFAINFADMGINVHAKENLTSLPWWAHQGLGKDYEDEWDEFFDQPRSARDVPAAYQLLKDLKNSPRFGEHYAQGQPATENYEGYEEIQAYINQRAAVSGIRGGLGGTISIIAAIGVFLSADTIAKEIDEDAMMYAADSQQNTPDGDAWAYVDLLVMRNHLNQLAPLAGDVAMAGILAKEACPKQN